MKNEAVAVAVQVNFQENMHTSRVVLCKLDHVPTSHVCGAWHHHLELNCRLSRLGYSLLPGAVTAATESKSEHLKRLSVTTFETQHMPIHRLYLMVLDLPKNLVLCLYLYVSPLKSFSI